MKYTTHNTVLEIIEKPKWRMRLRDATTGRVLSTRAEHDNDELVNAYFKKGKSFIHKVYVAYINTSTSLGNHHKGKAMRKNPDSSYVIDTYTKGHKTLIRKLSALKSTIEVYFNGPYWQDQSLCQVILTTTMSEDQLDHWLWATKGIDYVGIAPYDNSANKLVAPE
jgi:hypothetical protein